MLLCETEARPDKPSEDQEEVEEVEEEEEEEGEDERGVSAWKRAEIKPLVYKFSPFPPRWEVKKL